jgi:hypothetical protein
MLLTRVTRAKLALVVRVVSWSVALQPLAVTDYGGEAKPVGGFSEYFKLRYPVAVKNRLTTYTGFNLLLPVPVLVFSRKREWAVPSASATPARLQNTTAKTSVSA